MLNKFPFRSRFELSAALAALTTVPLLILVPSLWFLPAVVFGLLCLVGPYAQRLSFFLPIVRRGKTQRPEIAITFDDGPDPETTPALLELLSRFGFQVTFFVIGEKVAACPDLVRAILDGGHDIGNHSDTHDVFLMLKGRRKIEAEIITCQERLADFSIRPKTFRPPVGITNPHLRPILENLGLTCVGFSCRATDFGNRRINGMAEKVLKKIRPGDILLLHDCKPHGEMTSRQLMEEMERIFVGLQSKQLQPVPLSTLIDRPVMDKIGATR